MSRFFRVEMTDVATTAAKKFKKRKSRKTLKSLEVDRGETSSVSLLRKRLRDTDRLLKKIRSKGQAPAKLELELERKKKALEIRLTNQKPVKAKLSEKEKKLAEKYKMVKFIERKKVERVINRLTKALNNSSSTSNEDLEKELLQKRIELDYILLL